MSAPRIGTRGLPDTVNDMRVVEAGPVYRRLMIDALSQSQAVSSLVCNGAIPMQIDNTSEPDDKLLGRNLITSYVTDAYNAVCNHYRTEKKFIEHCMYRTTGELGYVMDYEDRVWSADSAGAYLTVAASEDHRRVVLETTNQILSKENDVRPVQAAFLDALLLPLVQTWAEAELSCEAMMYVSTTFYELKKNLAPSDLAVLKSAFSKVEGTRPREQMIETGGDPDDTFTRNLLGVIAVELGLPTPSYMSTGGTSFAYADIVRRPHTSRNEWLQRHCLTYKLWIDHVQDRNRAGLLIATFLNTYLDWGGSDPALDDFANELLENESTLPQPIDVINLPHRAITQEKIMGVSCIQKEIEVPGGKLVTPTFGEITTSDFSGRKVGYVDKRRTVVYFDDNGDIVVQFKNARNYFLNVLYYVRPGKFVRTEVRDAVVDRDKLVGQPAIYLLLRGQTNEQLSRFVIGAFMFGAISVKSMTDKGITGMLGKKRGKYDFEGIVSVSVLTAFPTVFDSKRRLYLYHNGVTYRAKYRAFQWHICREDMKEQPVGFGKLTTASPAKN